MFLDQLVLHHVLANSYLSASLYDYPFFSFNLMENAT